MWIKYSNDTKQGLIVFGRFFIADDYSLSEQVKATLQAIIHTYVSLILGLKSAKTVTILYAHTPTT